MTFYDLNVKYILGTLVITVLSFLFSAYYRNSGEKVNAFLVRLINFIVSFLACFLILSYVKIVPPFLMLGASGCIAFSELLSGDHAFSNVLNLIMLIICTATSFFLNNILYG